MKDRANEMRTTSHKSEMQTFTQSHANTPPFVLDDPRGREGTLRGIPGAATLASAGRPGTRTSPSQKHHGVPRDDSRGRQHRPPPVGVRHDHAVRCVQGPRHGWPGPRQQRQPGGRAPDGRIARRDCGRRQQRRAQRHRCGVVRVRTTPRVQEDARMHLLVWRQGRVKSGVGANNVHETAGRCRRERRRPGAVDVRRKVERGGGVPPQHPPGKARGREGPWDHRPQDQPDPPDVVAAARREACGRGRWGQTGAVSGWRRRGGGGWRSFGAPAPSCLHACQVPGFDVLWSCFGEQPSRENGGKPGKMGQNGESSQMREGNRTEYERKYETRENAKKMGGKWAHLRQPFQFCFAFVTRAQSSRRRSPSGSRPNAHLSPHPKSRAWGLARKLSSP